MAHYTVMYQISRSFQMYLYFHFLLELHVIIVEYAVECGVFSLSLDGEQKVLEEI